MVDYVGGYPCAAPDLAGRTIRLTASDTAKARMGAMSTGTRKVLATVLAVLPLAVSLPATASPKRVILEFKDAGIGLSRTPERYPARPGSVPPPPSYYAVLSLPRAVLAPADEFQLVKPEATVFHLGRQPLGAAFWKVDLAARKVTRITEGTFGAAAVTGADLDSVSVEAGLGDPKVVSLVEARLKIPSVTLECDTETGLCRLQAAGDLVAEYPKGTWIWEEEGPQRYRLRRKEWANSFLRVDTGRMVAELEDFWSLEKKKPPPILAVVRLPRRLSAVETAAGVGDDIGMTRVGDTTVLDSPWIARERQTARALLASGSYDTLVAPFQVQGFAFDQPGRSLMARYLAASLHRRSGLRLPDPALVHRALGVNARIVDEHEILALADELKVRHLVRGYAGHDLRGAMKMTLLVQERSEGVFPANGHGVTVVELNGIPFTDETPPEEVFRTRLEEILAKLPFVSSPRAAPAATAASASASALQLFGTLCPVPGPARQDFFERSLVVLDGIDRGAADVRLLVARALFHLHRRPAALIALGEPAAPEHRAFAALLEGDLPELEKQIDEIASPLLRVFALAELADLGWAYKRQEPLSETRRAFLREFPDWEPLVNARLMSGYPWPVQSVGEPKGLSLAPAMHNPDALSERDYLDLFSAFGEAELVKHLEADLLMRGLPERVLETLDGYKTDYAGHPVFEYLASYASFKASVRSEGAVRERLQGEERDHAARCFFASGGQTPSSKFCRMRIAVGGGLYDEDFPSRVGWGGFIGYRGDRLALDKGALHGRNAASLDPAFDEDSAQRLVIERSLLYTHAEFGYFKGYYARLLEKRGKEAAARFLEANPRRFNGHPDRPMVLADAGRGAGRPDETSRRLEEAIAATPDVWKLYKALGDARLVDGDFPGAAEAYGRFPPFTSAGRGSEPVIISNNAFEAGVALWLRGAVEEARPFLSFTANSRTGSAAEMMSGAILALLDRDFPLALERLSALVQRYNDPQGMMYAIELLHLLGRSEEGWALFDKGLSSVGDRKYLLLVGAFVGHRLEGRTDDELFEWIGREDLLASKRITGQTLMEFLVDRTPDASVGERFAALELKELRLHTPSPQLPDSAFLPAMRFTPLARGCGQVLRGEYAAAVETFGPLAERIGGASGLREMALPYAVRAAVKTGQAEQVEKLLAGETKIDTAFYRHLAEAQLLGVRGRHEDALAALGRAHSRIPSMGGRVLPPWYQLVEVAEWLHRETAQDAYRQRALAWARAHQRILPMYAWAYAVEARFADDPAERRRALATTLLLDRRSARIAEVSTEEKRDASAWLEQNNPFRREPGESEGSDVPYKAVVK